MPIPLVIGDIQVEVVRKDIQHVRLSVLPPAGRVRISAPRHVGDDALRAFAVGKLDWIRKHQRRIREQPREPRRMVLDPETHFVWGERCLLQIVERDAPPDVQWQPGRLMLMVRPGTDAGRRASIVDDWYRAQVCEAAEPLAAVWERRMGVRVNGIVVRHMRTRWGSCTPATGMIRLNTELAKKPRECLEYVLVHELAHLLEPSHNARFVALMDRFLPGWPQRRALLNRLPVRDEAWGH